MAFSLDIFIPTTTIARIKRKPIALEYSFISQTCINRCIEFKDNSDSPFIFSAGNKTTAHEKYGDSVDFDGLKAIGWAYSSINSVDLIYKDDLSAMVGINFSRYNTNNEAISTTDVTYMLVFKDDMWKLKAGFVQGDLSLGKK